MKTYLLSNDRGIYQKAQVQVAVELFYDIQKNSSVFLDLTLLITQYTRKIPQQERPTP